MARAARARRSIGHVARSVERGPDRGSVGVDGLTRAGKQTRAGMGRTNSVESDECGDVERLTTIFEVERGMEEAIKRDAPVQEIAAILANKKPTP